MFHTMLDAAGDVLKVHYKRMKCIVSFSQGSISTILGEVDIILYMCKNFFLLTTVLKITQID